MEKVRNTFIDELKGIAILLVVIGHILQFIFKVDVSGLLFSVIYSFHMPFFMFLAGYSLSLGHKALEFKYVIKRFFLLIIPFFVWGGVFMYIRHRDSFVGSFISMLKYPNEGLWFLWVLAFITVFIFLGQQLSLLLKNEIGFVIVALLLTGGFLVCRTALFGFDLISLHYIFFLIGYKFKPLWTGVSEKKKCIIKIFCLVLFIVLLIFWRFPGVLTFEDSFISDMWAKNSPSVVIYFVKLLCFLLKNYVIQITGIIAVIVTYQLLRRFVFELVRKFFSLLGKHTLEIYAVHVLVVYDLTINGLNVYCDALLRLVLSLALSILVGYVFSLNKYTAYAFLGKKVKK